MSEKFPPEEAAGHRPVETDEVKSILDDLARRIAQNEDVTDAELRQTQNVVNGLTGRTDEDFESFYTQITDRATRVEQEDRAREARDQEVIEKTEALKKIIAEHPDDVTAIRALAEEIRTQDVIDHRGQTVREFFRDLLVDPAPYYTVEELGPDDVTPPTTEGEPSPSVSPATTTEPELEPINVVPPVETTLPESETPAVDAPAAWSLPQPGRRVGKDGKPLRRLTTDQREKAEAEYSRLRTEIEQKWPDVEWKYQQLDKKQREDSVRSDPEMQPLLKEYVRAKELLAHPVRRDRRAPQTTEPKSTVPSGASSAPSEAEPVIPVVSEPTVGPVPEAPASDIQPRGTIAPETTDHLSPADKEKVAATTAAMAVNTPMGPLRTELSGVAKALGAEVPVEPEPIVPPVQPAPSARPVTPSRTVRDFNPEAPMQDEQPLYPAGYTGETIRPTEPVVIEDAATRVSGTPETVGTPEAREVAAMEFNEKLIQAEETYAKALRREGHWWNFGNKSKLEKAKNEYDILVGEARQKGALAIVEKFKQSGRLDNPVVQDTCIAEALAFEKQFVSQAQAHFREAMRGDKEQSGFEQKVEHFRTWWRVNSKARAVVSAGLFGIGMAGALTGNFFVTGAASALRGAIAAVGSEGAMRAGGKAIGRKWGASKEMTAEHIGKITDLGELRTRISAHTFDTLEFGEEKFGVRKVGKREDRTGAMLQERYGELLRAEMEKGVLAQKEAGKTPDQIIDWFLSSTVSDRHELHNAYVQRLHKNKLSSQIRVTASAGIGLLAGMASHTGAEHLSKTKAADWVKNLFHFGHDDTHRQVVAGAGRAGRSFVMAAPDTSHTVSAAVEAPAHTAAQEAAAQNIASMLEKAQKGDNVWALSERFFGTHAPGLTPEHASRFAAYAQEAIRQQASELGITDLSKINIDQTIDYSKIDWGKVDFSKIGDAHHFRSLQEVLDSVKGTSAQTLRSIAENNQTIQEWSVAHPGEAVTGDLLRTVAKGTKKAIVAVASEPSTPSIAVEATGSVPGEAIDSAIAQSVERSVQAAEVAAPVTQEVAKTLLMRPEISSAFDTLRIQILPIASEARSTLTAELSKMSLQQAETPGLLEGVVSKAVTGAPEKTAAVVESVRTFAKALRAGGHLANESVAAGIEWTRSFQGR